MLNTDVRKDFNKQIIVLQLGQCGVQLGHACWELFAAEHGIKPNGQVFAEALEEEFNGMDVLFNEASNGDMVPRTCFIDTEVTTIDEIRMGVYRNMFCPTGLINGLEDAANNFARGRNVSGKQVIDQTHRQLRQMVNDCSNLQGFVLLLGAGGGTGGGLGQLIMNDIKETYSKKDIQVVSVMPGRAFSMCTVEPYNVVLCNSGLTNNANMVISVDNESMYKVCDKKLGILTPTYNNMNRLLGQVYSDITSSYRFPTCVGLDFDHCQTNIIPYPRIHFLSTSYAPLSSLLNNSYSSNTTFNLTKEVFEKNNQLVEINFLNGKFMACNLQYRGLCGPAEICESINLLKSKNRYKFVDWSPTGFKTGLCTRPSVGTEGYEPLHNLPKTLCMLANHTAMGDTWRLNTRKFKLLYNRRAFLHWFSQEGMEEQEIMEAFEDVLDLINDYQILGRK